MTSSILVLAEHWRGQVSDITYEVLAHGREAADRLGAPLHAALLGHKVRGLAASLGKADLVLSLDHPALAEPTPDACAQAVSALIEARHPIAVLVPLSNIMLSVGSLVAARLGIPVVNFCKQLTVCDGVLQAQCVLYGGKVEAVVNVAQTPAVLGIYPGGRTPEQGRATQAPPIEDVAVTLPEPCIRLTRYIDPEASDVDITRQNVLIAVGRGIQSRDNVALAEELAAALGGAVCGSRPVIDQGWLQLSRQVGKSGLNVKPKLYIAAGISGAPEHVEGMKNADLIVAINSDAGAPIFDVAHLGIVGDALEVLPALTEAVQARKG